MIKAENISFSYNSREILKNICMEVKEGEIVSLLGMNGSGKTTLLKILSGILKPEMGRVYINNREISEFSRRELARYVAYMQQKVDGITSTTVFEAILLGRKPHITFEVSRRDLDIVESILDTLGLSHLAFRNTLQLSGGELQKVFIGMALAQEPKVLLLDEPINHLDIKNQIEIMTLIKEITKKMNLTTILVLHDIAMALRFTDKFLLLKDGQIFSYVNKDGISRDLIKNVFNIDALIEKFNDIYVVIPVGTC